MQHAVLEIFNGVNNNIQFTCECENDCSLPFLDTLVIRCPTTGTISTKWYRKPVSSGRLLNYNSFHPMSQKIGMAKGFIYRVLSLCSKKYENEHIHIATDALLKNGFPVKLINGLINTRRKLDDTSSVIVPNTPMTTISTTSTSDFDIAVTTTASTPSTQNDWSICSVPYIQGITEKIKKTMRRELPNIKLSFKPMKKPDMLFSRTKDQVPVGRQSNLVYSISCEGCDDRCYIGTTKQLLENRLKQHKVSVERLQTEKSALALHAVTNQHRFDFKNAFVMYRCPHYTQRMFIEELCIKSSNRCVNIKSREAMNVSSIYTALLHTYNHNKQTNDNKRNSTQPLTE